SCPPALLCGPIYVCGFYFAPPPAALAPLMPKITAPRPPSRLRFSPPAIRPAVAATQGGALQRVPRHWHARKRAEPLPAGIVCGVCADVIWPWIALPIAKVFCRPGKGGGEVIDHQTAGVR